jgi:hypothetical protein
MFVFFKSVITIGKVLITGWISFFAATLAVCMLASFVGASTNSPLVPIGILIVGSFIFSLNALYYGWVQGPLRELALLWKRHIKAAADELIAREEAQKRLDELAKKGKRK